MHVLSTHWVPKIPVIAGNDVVHIMSAIKKESTVVTACATVSNDNTTQETVAVPKNTIILWHEAVELIVVSLCSHSIHQGKFPWKPPNKVVVAFNFVAAIKGDGPTPFISEGA